MAITDSETTGKLLEPDTSVPLTSLSSQQDFKSYYPPPVKLVSNGSSRTFAFVGLAFSVSFGLFCTISGVYIAAYKVNAYSVVLPPFWPGGYPIYNVVPGMVAIMPNSAQHLIPAELVRFALTQLNTICTEAIGFVHTVTQRSTLATHSVTVWTPSRHAFKATKREENALRFNTNLRFFTAPPGSDIGFFHPNATFCNALMALLLILSYASVSLTMLSFTAAVCTDDGENGQNRCNNLPEDQTWGSICIFAAPILVLGISIILKVAIAAAGVYYTRILTWSSSPLETTAAVILDGQVTHVSGRCMYSILDLNSKPVITISGDKRFPAKKPSVVQPSAWQAHRKVRCIIKALWVLVLMCGVWGGIIVAVWHSDTQSGSNSDTPGLESWALIPSNRSNTLKFGPAFSGPDPVPVTSWIICFAALVVVQGALTMALHCCELVVNVLRDEDTWRKATSRDGTKCVNPIISTVRFWPSVVLYAAKPLLQWMFGFCLSLQGTIGYLSTPEQAKNDDGFTQASIQVIMRSVQTWYLMIALAVFSAFFTFFAMRRPKNPQPATYGHIQTLANLIDNWPPDMRMWWGHKSGDSKLQDEHANRDHDSDDKIVCHAGTADAPLPPVVLDCLYA